MENRGSFVCGFVTRFCTEGTKRMKSQFPDQGESWKMWFSGEDRLRKGAKGDGRTKAGRAAME